MDSASLILLCAYALDMGLGDPRWLPHPVRGIGWMIQRGEAWSRSLIRPELLAGAVLVLGVVGLAWGAAQGLVWAAAGISRPVGWAVELLLLYTCLSTKDLAVESWPVYRALKAGDLDLARQKVSLIVGRDTQNLDEPEIVRAAIETIGESVMDGIVAPLFYAAIGGAPLAVVYKAINTLDSMVGYRSSRYIRFGKAAARVDAWVNAVPARLTGGLLVLAGGLAGFSFRKAGKAMMRDAWNRGENSWIPEAALGGALGVRLGGSSSYQGKTWEAPALGDPHRALSPERIAEAIRVMYVSSLLSLGVILSARFVFLQVF